MKISASTFAVVCALPAINAFVPSAAFNRKSSVVYGLEQEGDVIFGGNEWNPDADKMRSTDVGDYFPDDYEADVEFTEGMMGSQGGRGGNDGPELPGMENLGADALVMGGIDSIDEVPEGTEFIPSSVPDFEVEFRVSSIGKGIEHKIDVKPVCMTYEDYYAGFSKDSHPSLSVAPATGRMDRRGGEISQLTIFCNPKGRGGTLTGDLVIILPEDNSKICYKVTAESF